MPGLMPSLPPSPPSAPSPWVARFAPLIPPGEVLDLACGSGRHAALLASSGHPVLAADRDRAALQAAARPGVTTLEWDFEEAGARWPFAAARFAGIVITNYLYRPLWPHLLASLAPGGVLIIETFGQGNALFGKPSNPDFLLAPGELPAALQAACPPGSALRMVAFEDGYLDARKAVVQRICVLKTTAGGEPASAAEIALRLRLDP